MSTIPVSVVIPTLNEGDSIGRVVAHVRNHPLVAEVIVVDDKSLDCTTEQARISGATVMTSTKIGKGASMRDGFLISKGQIVVYLDGDIEDYVPDIIDRLTAPLLNASADFAKASFSRQAGRVTELVARPLLSLLFPELTKFAQPLSGMTATTRDWLKRVTFEDDYGVDIGLLIDMQMLGARIVEVDIGSIRNKMKPWQQLGKMSREVARAILKRASASNLVNLDGLQSIDVIRHQMDFAILESLLSLKKMMIFDMDNTILRGRFIEVAAKRFGFEKQLVEILSTNHEPYVRTKLIAQNLKGKLISELLTVTESIPMIGDTRDVVATLKSRGYVVGIISDSYDCVATHVKTMINADFALAHELEFSNSMATGEVKIPSFFIRTPQSSCQHTVCKANALLSVATRYGIELPNIVAVGDSESDICLARAAGVGVSFCSASELLNAVADYRIDTPSFAPILDVAR